jgi:hypothetical protein
VGVRWAPAATAAEADDEAVVGQQINQDIAIDQAARRDPERGADRARSGFDTRRHGRIIACRASRLPRAVPGAPRRGVTPPGDAQCSASA